jgi:hypothetical protein
MNIQTLSTTKVRDNISDIVNTVYNTGKSIVIGRRDNPEAIIIPFPKDFNPKLSEITNINTYSHSFSFLKKEPDIYSVLDLKKKYA